MPAAFSVEVGASSDVGKEQAFNGDTYCASVVEESADNPWKINALLAVADSRSAMVNDTPVSELAVKAVVRSFVSPEAGSAGYRRIRDRDLELFLRIVTEYVNDLIYHAGNGVAGPHVGTTLTFAVVRGNRYYISHVGNSRAYLFRDGRIRQLTCDHSWIAEQVRQREMTAAEARHSPFRDRLTQAVGMRSTVEPDLLTNTLREGDVLLLCSDGLTKRVTEEDVRRTLSLSSSLQRACEQLVQMAKDRETDDAITVVGVRMGTASKPLTDRAAESRPTVDYSRIENLLSAFQPVVDVMRSRVVQMTFILLLLGGLMVGVLSGSIFSSRRPPAPSQEPSGSPPPKTSQKITQPAPIESVLMKVIADAPKRGLRLHAPSRRVMLESKGEQGQGE
ncbi:MAG: protein phosphatase 2C domain-containing protein, partial [Abditibacteriales bacterium]|nr:protein phosphatase 2C domain-containing protein [Abditibacteriales bacterium]MDW8366196.1 protein phosphatase 2C domain-containing protein [Abditibacteriales bacterium]